MIIKRYIYLCLIAIMLVACSDNKEDSKTQSADNKTAILFNDTKTQKQISFDLIQSNEKVQLLSTPNISQQHMMILAIFPKECDACAQVLPHIGNLSSRLNDIDIAILKDNTKSSLQNDFLMPKNAKLLEFTAQGGAITFLVDSIKRMLNIQIKNYNDPLFLIIDKDGTILRSYEGAILEEILEIDIDELKNNKLKN